MSPRNAGERCKEAVGLMEHCGQGGVGGRGAEAVLVAAGGGRPGRGVGVAHPEVRQPRRHAAGHGGYSHSQADSVKRRSAGSGMSREELESTRRSRKSRLMHIAKQNKVKCNIKHA